MSNNYDIEREARRAAERGYLDHDQRERYENGARSYEQDSKDRIFHDAYRSERIREEHRQEERDAEERAERREFIEAEEARNREEEDYNRAMEEQYGYEQPYPQEDETNDLHNHRR